MQLSPYLSQRFLYYLKPHWEMDYPETIAVIAKKSYANKDLKKQKILAVKMTINSVKQDNLALMKRPAKQLMSSITMDPWKS